MGKLKHKPFQATVVKMDGNIKKVIDGYEINIIAEDSNGINFKYRFIKNKLEDCNIIKVGYTWTVFCKPMIIV